MKSTLFSVAALLASLSTVYAAPTQTLKARATQICGQYDSAVTGTYTVYQDLWGEGQASSGSQCTTVESLSGSALSWRTNWSWSGGAGQVKSYANAGLTMSARRLSAISSITSTWDWSYSGSSIVADVSYDMFTASTASGDSQYEIMVWLAALGGAGPISSTGSAIATPTIAGHSWRLYSGPNGATTVYSFVATSEVTAFSGNLMAFFQYLEQHEGFSSSQYLHSIQAGTEPFSGSNAVFTTTTYRTTIS